MNTLITPNQYLECAGKAKRRRRFGYWSYFGVLLGALFGILLPASPGAAQAQSQTLPAPAASPAPVGTAPPAARPPKPEANEPVTVGTIKGRVVSNDGRPLTNANIMAQGVSGVPTVKMKRTDAEGGFVFDDLPVGLYIVLATAPGYIDESWTGADPSELPRHLIGERLKITMIKGGVITGVVTDSKGQPVVGVPVQASPPSGASSLSSFMGGTTGETDDRGVYRIYGLPPGQYAVAAGGAGPFGQFTASGFELDVLTYYPSATRDTAVPVAVRSGDEATGIDIKYRGTEGHAISGVVLGPVTANAVGGAVIIILSSAGSSSIQAMALASAAEPRVFSFNGIADGEYDLFAGFQAGPTDNSLVASKRVVVRNGDLTGLELKLMQLSSIAGTITLDPLKDENKCDKRGSQVIEVLLKAPRDEAKKAGGPLMTSLFGGVGTSLNAKGEFTIKNLERGKYRFGFQMPTAAWYVRAINPPGSQPVSPPLSTAVSPPVTPSRGPAQSPSSSASSPVAQSELSQGVVTIKTGERVGGVTIFIGQDAAGLSGKVATVANVDGGGSAIPEGLRVHLVPAEREQANNVLRYSETVVNSDATFAFTNIAPGRYFIVTRIKLPAETEAARPRDLAWDAATRTKLRTEAEAANTIVELKPCQQLVDYSLKLQPVP